MNAGSVHHGMAGAARIAHAFHQILHFLRRYFAHGGDGKGDDEVDGSADRADAERRDAEDPVVRRVGVHVGAGDEEPAHVEEDVSS